MKKIFLWIFFAILTIVFTQIFIYNLFKYDVNKPILTNLFNSSVENLKNYTNNDSDSKIEDDNHLNYLCKRPKIEYDHVLAYEQVENDYKRLKPIFDSCSTELKFESFLKIAKNNNLETSNNETYTLKLEYELIKNNFGSKSKKMRCFIERFDKLMNVSEKSQKLKNLDRLYEFKLINDKYKLEVSNYGFYYLNCIDDSDRILFDYVFNILPTNMSKLIQDRKEYKILAKNRIKEFVIDAEIKKKMYENNIYQENKCTFKNKTVHKMMNVLLIGVDSLSRDQFTRIFPMTYIYLRDHLKDTLIFKNFNSNGENTFPNMLAFLTGSTAYKIPEYNVSSDLDFYSKYDSTYFDTIPFIWNDYEDSGYLTMLQEDHPSISTFNYLKHGFKFRPTSFYGRPFWNKYYSKRTGPRQCHRKYQTYSTWINLIDSLTQNFYTEINKDISYFSFNFIDEYTHDYMYVPYDLDVKFRNMIVKLEKNGKLDDTFLMIFSDHGIRLRLYGYGTDQGKLEKYNPFISIRLPKILKNTRYFKNSFENQFKMVTFFDLFQTLKHFLHINKYGIEDDISECNKKFRINDINERNTRGISIFEHINMNRSCLDGLIPLKLCNCLLRTKIDEKEFKLQTNYSFNNLSSYIVDRLNKITENERKKCELFKFDTLKSIELIKITTVDIYEVNILVQPGDALFEVMLKVDENYRKKYNQIKLVIDTLPKRLSPYGNQSHCINDVTLVNFCFCRVKPKKLKD